MNPGAAEISERLHLLQEEEPINSFNLEAGASRRICRICLDDEGTMKEPCLCDGTQRYVHQHCVLQYLRHKRISPTDKMAVCDLCLHRFQFRGQTTIRSITFRLSSTCMTVLATTALTIVAGTLFMCAIRLVGMYVNGSPSNISSSDCASYYTYKYNVPLHALCGMTQSENRAHCGDTSVEYFPIAHVPVKVAVFECEIVSGVVLIAPLTQVVFYSLLRIGQVVFCAWIPVALHAASQQSNICDAFRMCATLNLVAFDRQPIMHLTTFGFYACMEIGLAALTTAPNAMTALSVLVFAALGQAILLCTMHHTMQRYYAYYEPNQCLKLQDLVGTKRLRAKCAAMCSVDPQTSTIAHDMHEDARNVLVSAPNHTQAPAEAAPAANDVELEHISRPMLYTCMCVIMSSSSFIAVLMVALAFEDGSTYALVWLCAFFAGVAALFCSW